MSQTSREFWDSDVPFWIVGAIFIVACVIGVIGGWRARDRAQAEEARVERDARCACGSDVVYSFERFGAFDSPRCLKVMCWSRSERVMREVISCEESR